MTKFAARQDIARVAAIVAEPVQPEIIPGAIIRSEIDRSFELPAGLYIATVAAYLGFIAVMASAFLNPGLLLPMVIFAFFIVAGFGTPMLWVRMNPAKTSKPMSYQSFMNRGIQTATGHLGGGAAAVQVLILPVLILCWGISVAVIAALT